MRIYSTIAIIIGVAVTIIFYQNSKYVLEENKQVVIVQFGKVMKAQTAPGTYYKIPFIQRTHFYDDNIRTAEISHQVPTIDKKFLLLKIKSFWRISDPIIYFKSVHSFNNAENQVEDITEMAGRMVIISHELDEIINVTNITDPENIQSKREIEIEILEIAKVKLLEFGIGLAKLEGKISYPI
jgi:membrane protease subunit HflC